MQNRRVQITTTNKDFVFDNKVSGETTDSLIKKNEMLELKLRNSRKSIEMAELEIKDAVFSVVKNSASSDHDRRTTSAQERTILIKKQMEASLAQELGDSKARSITNKFIQDAQDRDFKRAAENLVRNIEESSKKFPNLKISAFERHAPEAKHDKSAIIKQMMLNNQKTNVQVTDSRNLDSIGSNDLGKSVTKYTKLLDIRDTTIRQMRRNARDLRSCLSKMININNADNGIAFDNVGLNDARFANEKLDTINAILNISENMTSQSSSRGSELNIDALLQKGRATMVQATTRSRGLCRHLIKQREREQERVRC
ncbi:MAG: hypothetical protein AB7U85_03030 [Alphaproteobacteria bacterium]